MTNGCAASAVAFGGVFDKYKIERTGGTWADKYGKNIQHWDVAPGEDYFTELFRVSKHAIIWGGNYFDLPPCRCFVVWKKLTISENFSMAMCEYAWTNFKDNAKIYEAVPQGKDRFHPTQKPVGLYSWLLAHFAEPGDRILDTHAGSASSLIACHAAGYEYMGFEIDPDYYAQAAVRLEKAKAQVSMFDADKIKQTEQVGFG
ncbi:MAG: site-specific DNA-methyltransferase [Clostridiales bacterium]|nr:site-specific DNA-methyltransferase [Clostridiales bacterium]